MKIALFRQIATLSLFIFLIAGFVAFRSGVFNEFFSANSTAIGSTVPESDSLKHPHQKIDSAALFISSRKDSITSITAHILDRTMTSSKTGVIFSGKDFQPLKKGDTITLLGKIHYVDSAKLNH